MRCSDNDIVPVLAQLNRSTNCFQGIAVQPHHDNEVPNGVFQSCGKGYVVMNIVRKLEIADGRHLLQHGIEALRAGRLCVLLRHDKHFVVIVAFPKVGAQFRQFAKGL